MTPRVALAPEPDDYAARAVAQGGGQVVGLDEEPDALVWTAPGGWSGLRPALDRAPHVRWVQLPFAGVEGVRSAGALVPGPVWTCAKGVYSEPVAEHALGLALAGLRGLPEHARARSWGEQSGVTLYDEAVVVLGGGGITTALVELLQPFRTRTTVVRRDASHAVDGAHRTVSLSELDDVLPGARVVVLALALTDETRHVIGREQLARMDADAWLVNVARGAHVDTDALVDALRNGTIGGAALDVTDPEPLPDGHPLWQLPSCMITPHTANPWTTAQPRLARRIADNVGRFGRGEPLLGLVDLQAGY